MNPPYLKPPPKRAGFRCSAWDLLVLALAGLGSALLWKAEVPLWWIVAVVTGHFFLFCNVFLLWRRWEMLWAGCFIAIVIWRFSLGDLGYFPALWFVLPATALVILLQIRSPFYHGIFARRLNPRLDHFLNDNLS